MRAVLRPALFWAGLGFLCLGAPPEARAAVLSQYTFPLATWTATTVYAGLVAGTVTHNTLPTWEIANYAYSTDPVLRFGPKAGATTAATAVSTGSYFYFSLTVTGGAKLNLTSLTFNVARGGATTPRGYVIRSSIDNYAADIASANVLTQRTTWTAVNIDLTGAAYQGLSGTVTFRFYIYSPATGSTLEVDSLTINGTVLPDVIFYGTLL